MVCIQRVISITVRYLETDKKQSKRTISLIISGSQQTQLKRVRPARAEKKHPAELISTIDKRRVVCQHSCMVALVSRFIGLVKGFDSFAEAKFAFFAAVFSK